MTKPARADAFFGSCFTLREKSACDPKLGNNFRESYIIQLLFCGANKRAVFVEISGAMADGDNDQAFKFEGVINYVDPMGFLGGKERIRLSINSNQAFIP